MSAKQELCQSVQDLILLEGEKAQDYGNFVFRMQNLDYGFGKSLSKCTPKSSIKGIIQTHASELNAKTDNERLRQYMARYVQTTIDSDTSMRRLLTMVAPVALSTGALLAIVKGVQRYRQSKPTKPAPSTPATDTLFNPIFDL